MAANAYASAGPAPPAFPEPPPFDNTTTRGIVVYEGAPTSATPIMPLMPAFTDTPTAHKFFTSITGLAGGPHWVPVPRHIDEHMFVTVGLGISICPTSTAFVVENGPTPESTLPPPPVDLPQC
ncbi:hypothetical protein H0E87_026684 [Populus deltoides]|uniref:Uncharacterized protein n=1 Tax=Populus deltoides TaxID=3696 RepID=A0A8T2WXV5_POPDE|nr:hypothetical protein H0E87_026684 [Populus deltoides]